MTLHSIKGIHFRNCILFRPTNDIYARFEHELSEPISQTKMSSQCYFLPQPQPSGGMPREIAFTVVVDVGNGIMARDIPASAENPPPTPVVGNMATFVHRETGEFTHHPILLVVAHPPGTTQSPPKELLMAMMDIKQKYTLQKAIGLEGLIVKACDTVEVDVMKVIGFR